MLNRTVNVGLIIVSLAYPFAIFFGLQREGINHLAPLLLIVAACHALKGWRGQRSSWLWVTVCLLLAAWGYLQETALALKFYPALISLGMLAIFGWSLHYPPSAVERIARISEPDFPIQAIGYTRRVTQVWCVFFIVNGSISVWTTFYASDETWVLYNGLISYLFMGLLFSAEYLVRRQVRRQYHD